MKKGDWILLELGPERSAQARRALQSGLAQVVEAEGGLRIVVKPRGTGSECFVVNPSEIVKVVAE